MRKKYGPENEVIHMDRGCPSDSATMAGNSVGKGYMSKKEQFMAFVWVGALHECRQGLSGVLQWRVQTALSLDAGAVMTKAQG
jgi:hypothetical protein